MIIVAEVKIVVDQLTINYEGLFKMKDLLKIIEDYFRRDRGYDWMEKKNEVIVTPSGKHYDLDFVPWKTLNDYTKLEAQIKISGINITEVDVEHDGVKVKLNKGKLSVVFNGYIHTDYEGKWEDKPIFYFIRTLVDKYIYSSDNSAYQKMIADDVEIVRKRVAAFLNLYRYT